MTRKISLQKGEDGTGGRVFILRLDGTGAGSMETGDRCLVSGLDTDEERRGEVVGVERKRLKDLTEDDASRVLTVSDSYLSTLRMKLDQYRFRPQWDQEETRFRILEIELMDKADGGE